ncbi:MAG: sulfite exporter TauE/SafE family protein, partial [Bdellovibrionota bacterium]
MSTLLLCMAILSSSFWGSWHCAAMCSPTASLMTKKKSLWSYNLGRGLSYIFLGTLGGLIGSFFLDHQFYLIRIFSGVLFALILVFMGLNIIIKNKPFTLPRILGLRHFATLDRPGIYLGLLTAFLPCGWLYSYVLAAVATRSAVTGGLVMGIFWLGTLPALSAISLYMKRAIRLTPRHKHLA